MMLPRNAQIWLPSLLRQYAGHHWRRRASLSGVHVMLAIADHFEPFNGGVGRQVADARVKRWAQGYSQMAAGLRDADGRMPQHSFFYPIEQYDERHADALATLVEFGSAEIEVHLHHENDTSIRLRQTLLEFVRLLHHRHGLLTKHSDGSIGYGFVHGNWALDNARPDGRCCGVNNEITVLRETGCYADFTLPAIPDVSQTRTVNSIYYAVDDPSRPKSHDRGVRATVGRCPPNNGLLLIQGPLRLDWTRRFCGVLPGVDTAALDDSPGNWPSGRRFRAWLASSVSVAGRPEWVFIKIHTHGAPERNADVLLGQAMREFHTSILEQVRNGGMYLHYVTAREMANIVRASEHGAMGHPGEYRDYWLPPPIRARRIPPRVSASSPRRGKLPVRIL
jgi:hypothetical protein